MKNIAYKEYTKIIIEPNLITTVYHTEMPIISHIGYSFDNGIMTQDIVFEGKKSSIEIVSIADEKLRNS